jgi:hypothetical protein
VNTYKSYLGQISEGVLISQDVMISHVSLHLRWVEKKFPAQPSVLNIILKQQLFFNVIISKDFPLKCSVFFVILNMNIREDLLECVWKLVQVKIHGILKHSILTFLLVLFI